MFYYTPPQNIKMGVVNVEGGGLTSPTNNNRKVTLCVLFCSQSENRQSSRC